MDMDFSQEWVNTESLCLVNILFVIASIIRDKYYNIYVPYGRFSNAVKSADGKFEFRKTQPIPARLAWFIMEIPNMVCGSYIMYSAYNRGTGRPLGWLVGLLFMFHYIIRTFVYSFLLKGAKAMPLDILCYGVFFTSVNGSIQTYHHLFEAKYEPAASLISPQTVRIIFGLGLFFTGFAMNQWCDAVLRSLRKDQSDMSYYLPRGTFFEYLSAPNLVGEIVEWLGYAIVANTWVAYGFFVSTLIVVGRRAIGHHEWYQKKFENYPKQRKALIPFFY